MRAMHGELPEEYTDWHDPDAMRWFANYGAEAEPTHWMPLPTAPGAAVPVEGAGGEADGPVIRCSECGAPCRGAYGLDGTPGVQYIGAPAVQPARQPAAGVPQPMETNE